MADIRQLIPFEHAQDKSAKIFSAASRFRKSRYHGLLCLPRLHLQPLPAPSARLVGALSMFGDDPFESLFLGDIEKQDAVFRYVIAESYFQGRRKNFF